MRVVLIGGMAAIGRDLIERQLRSPWAISVMRDQREVADRATEIERADAIVGFGLGARVIEAAKNARLIQVAGIGVDGMPFDLLRPGVTVANTHHHQTSIAEHILMCMLMLVKRPGEYDRQLRAGDWRDSCVWGETPNIGVIEGRTALFLGLGYIAKETAARSRAFGMRNVVLSRTPEGVAEGFALRAGYDRLDEQLATADFVIPSCPLAPETEGLIGATQLSRMRPDAYLINTARGPVVDERALYKALREGRIAGAAIDVWYRYPDNPAQPCFPSRFPFHELPNVILTPHISGWTMRTVEGRMRDIAENLNRLADGRELLNVVYRAD